MPTISITLTPDLDTRLNALAQQQGYKDTRTYLVARLKELMQEDGRRVAIEAAMQQADSDAAGIT